MKILMLSDIHLRDSGSRFRIDNFKEVQFRKLEWCLNLGAEQGCELILQAGDLFDSVRASNQLISDTITSFKKVNLDIFAVSGNHDQRFRDRSLVNTPIKVVESAGAIDLLSSDPINYQGVDIYGCHWGDEIPKIVNKDRTNILVIHKMIIQDEDEKIWQGQTGYSTSRMMLTKNKFDVILSADNHKYFIDEYQGRQLFNLGSLTRLNAAQIDYRPKIAIFDTDTKTYKLFEVPITPSSEAFDLEIIAKTKDHKEIDTSIKEYVDILNGTDSETKELNFVSNLDRLIAKYNVRESVVSIIKSTLEC